MLNEFYAMCEGRNYLIHAHIIEIHLEEDKVKDKYFLLGWEVYICLL